MKISTSIFKHEAKFIAGADSVSRLPKLIWPEIAFIGKSNVGKSSLINTVCKCKNLAHISNTPGRTRQINFFELYNKLLLVDLPGYGYAKVSQSQQRSWEKLIVHYLQHSPNLILINLLIDARRGLKQNDFTVIELFKKFDHRFQIILTKCDKKEATDTIAQDTRNQAERIMPITKYSIISSSSKNAMGIVDIRCSIVDAVADAKL